VAQHCSLPHLLLLLPLQYHLLLLRLLHTWICFVIAGQLGSAGLLLEQQHCLHQA
jgi:hypothetical protein